MRAVAVVLPAYEPRLLGERRDAWLTAHAVQFAHQCARTNARVRIFTTGSGAAPAVQILGKRWSVATNHDLLAAIEAFAPTEVLIEHVPLAYDGQVAVPLSVAAWARIHGVASMLVAHPEYGRRCDPPESVVIEALAAAYPAFAAVPAILCHESSWARFLGQHLPALVPRLDLLDDWTPVEPTAIVPIDTAAPALLLLDDAAAGSLSGLFERLRDDGLTYRCVTLFGSTKETARIRDAMAAFGIEEKIQIVAADSLVELAQALSNASFVIVAESRRSDSGMRWARCAAAHGRRAVVLRANGVVQPVESVAISSWTSIAHRVFASFDAIAASATAFEEDVQEPPVGI
ncbi:MAG TPA: hypothetical protein VIN40_07125 [Candidatus Tyrphobacter sp.]